MANVEKEVLLNGVVEKTIIIDADSLEAYCAGNGYTHRDPVAQVDALDAEMFRREVQDRIFAEASQNTQINLAGAAAAGLLTAEQITAFQSGLGWIAAMRAKGVELASNQDATFRDDIHWPVVPADAAALAAAF